MTAPQLVAEDLGEAIPRLLADASVVALVPATELRGWAAEMAWFIAQAAATGGRRTALVDAFVDAPTLHQVAGTPNDVGLVDVFEYGASLNRIVQSQPDANLFFVPAGTFAPDAQPVMANPRWRRLSAGFRHEEALLLLYVSAEHLGTLAAEPDGLIVLAPQGLDLAVTAAPAVATAVAQGLRLIAVVAHRSAPGLSLVPDQATEAPSAEPAAELPPPAIGAAPAEAAPPEGPEAPRPLALLVDRRPSRRWPWIAAVVAAAAAGATGWIWLRQLREARAVAAETARRDSLAAAAARAARQSEAARRAALAARAGPLPFVVQVAAPDRLDVAFAAADSLEAHGTPAIIAPLRLARQGPLYRVFAGPFPSGAAAESVLIQLRGAGTLGPREGAAAELPLSLALTGGLTAPAAAAERARLRTAGVPAFVLAQADGTFRLFAGAYDAAVQAALLQDLLTPTGSAGDLVPRTGTVP